MSVQSKGTPAVARGVPRLQFFKDVVSELKKVTWPTRREAGYLTILVLIVSGALGVVLGTVDFVFAKIVQVFLLQ